MDLGNIVPLVLIGILGAGAAVFLGFLLPAPVHKVDGESSGEPQQAPVPDQFSTSMKKYLADPSGQWIPAPKSVAAWGRGRISSRLPIFGRTWLPLSWTLYLVPGSSFVIYNRITWFRRNFIRGGEEYRSGKGAFMLGRRPVENPYLDETERALVWYYTIWLAPGSLVNHPAVKWEERDGIIQVEVCEENLAPLQFTVTLDPQTGKPQTITGVRKGSRTGEDYPFEAALSQPKDFGDAGVLPTQWIANWDRDVYLKLALAGIVLDSDIEPVMQGGIDALPA